MLHRPSTIRPTNIDNNPEVYIPTKLKIYHTIVPISTHGWNWFPKEMCFIDFLMTLTLQYCNSQYYLSQHKFNFIPTKNAEIVSFSSKCSVFCVCVIRQLVLYLRVRSRLFFLILVIFQTNQVLIRAFILRILCFKIPILLFTII